MRAADHAGISFFLVSRNFSRALCAQNNIRDLCPYQMGDDLDDSIHNQRLAWPLLHATPTRNDPGYSPCAARTANSGTPVILIWFSHPPTESRASGLCHTRREPDTFGRDGPRSSHRREHLFGLFHDAA